MEGIEGWETFHAFYTCGGYARERRTFDLLPLARNKSKVRSTLFHSARELSEQVPSQHAIHRAPAALQTPITQNTSVYGLWLPNVWPDGVPAWGCGGSS